MSAIRAVALGLSRGNGVSGSVVTVVRADGPGRLSAMTEVTRILSAIEQGDPQATNALARQEPLKAKLVKLRYFAGLSVEETAACLGISPVTAKRQWAVARAWLYAALADDEVTGPGRKKLRQGDPAST